MNNGDTIEARTEEKTYTSFFRFMTWVIYSVVCEEIVSLHKWNAVRNNVLDVVLALHAINLVVLCSDGLVVGVVPYWLFSCWGVVHVDKLQ